MKPFARPAGDRGRPAGRPPLIIPVENQVRELDAKLLLAVVAARRGFAALIGSRREIHFHIGALPVGIYVSKSMTAASRLMFDIMRRLGHRIVAWDEEALVHLPADTYYSRRLSPPAMRYVSGFFAWGEDNAALWRDYPHFPDPGRIHVTGNPRNDLLRPEIRGYYDEEVRRIRAAHGDFVLINTNFNHVNAFSPVQNLFQPPRRPGGAPRPGRAAKGMTPAFAEGFRRHKEAIFSAFLRLVPALEEAFPGMRFVVRPHPTENPEVYRRAAVGRTRVAVTNDGNVVPWLLAAKALIHNGCTTGVEAYALGVPAITYRPAVNDDYDLGFYGLPNRLSRPCFDFDELRRRLDEALHGRFALENDAELRRVAAAHLAALNGPLACERIVAAIDGMLAASPPNGGGAAQRLIGRALGAGRTAWKRVKDARPGSHNRPAFQRHRYPPLTAADVAGRVARFRAVLGDVPPIAIRPLLGQFFILTPQPPA
jgi:surface carbohydrate biosynthesis protein